MQNPHFGDTARSPNVENTYTDPMMATSPVGPEDGDEEISYEKLELEAREVNSFNKNCINTVPSIPNLKIF